MNTQHALLSNRLQGMLLALALLLAPACVSETALESQFSCPSEGSIDAQNRRICRGGLWERLADAGSTTSDMGGDACVPISDEALCKGSEKASCGDTTLVDNCGVSRTVSCQKCEIGFACVQGKCDELKGCETKEQLCDRVDAVCGQIKELDNCGTSREEECGGCPNPNDACVNNECVCQPESEAQTCARAGKTCGTVTLTNNCGQMVNVNCGTCTKGDCEGDNTCSQCDAETKEAFCTRLGKTCGSVTAPDACTKQSRTEICGTCDNDRVCSAQGACECPEVDCTLIECGDASNACGKSKNCGNCGTNQLCSNNVCVCEPETNTQLCSNEGANCGTINVIDRCQVKREIKCGDCTGGNVCNNNLCCRPQTNDQLCRNNGLACGTKTVTDNCGQSRNITCGGNNACPGPYNTCQSDNQCACNDPRNDAQLCTENNLQCGSRSVNDGCNQSRSVNCGSVASSCSAPDNRCTNNQCACVDNRNNSQLCAANSLQCGSKTITDACGVSKNVNCGAASSCSPPNNTCDDNQCVCVDPRTDAMICSGRNWECGTRMITDSCGQSRTVDCGPVSGCPAPANTCSLGNKCVCEDNRSTMQICNDLGRECGTHGFTDICGIARSVTCPMCTSPDICSAEGKCEPPSAPDMGGMSTDM